MFQIHSKFTEDEISTMQEALDRYNLQLPVFSKIGGILASEISIDEAALHAAIIAVNQALEKDSLEELLKSLQNPGFYYDTCRKFKDYNLAIWKKIKNSMTSMIKYMHSKSCFS